MEALRELENRLGLRELNFHSSKVKEVEETPPLPQANIVERVNYKMNVNKLFQLAKSWGISIQKVSKAYQKVYDIREATTDTTLRAYCEDILSEMQDDTISLDDYNMRLYEIRKVVSEKCLINLTQCNQ